MSRCVKDSIVVRRCEETGFDVGDIDNTPIYMGDVIEGIERVRIDQSEFGLQKESVIKGVRDKYEVIQITDTDFYIDVGPKITVTKDQIRVLKALAVEQVNRNLEYSDAVAFCFMSLLKQVINKKVTGEFMADENCSPMQLVVIEAITEFVKLKLVSN